MRRLRVSLESERRLHMTNTDLQYLVVSQVSSTLSHAQAMSNLNDLFPKRNVLSTKRRYPAYVSLIHTLWRSTNVPKLPMVESSESGVTLTASDVTLKVTHYS